MHVRVMTARHNKAVAERKAQRKAEIQALADNIAHVRNVNRETNMMRLKLGMPIGTNLQGHAVAL